MSDILIKLFIKNKEDTANPAVRGNYGLLAGIIGIISNLILCTIKFLTGIIFNSIAITADAVNNLSDAGSSVITLVGFKMSEKPADEEHPYGHARFEYIAGLVVSFIIFALGLELIRTSVEKIMNPQQASTSILTIIILIIAILLKLWQCGFYKHVGKIISSTTLQATAADSLNDVMATSAVLLSAIISHYAGINLDGYMGVGVALFIIVSGIKLISTTINPLLGMAPDREFVKKIQDKLMSYDGVIGIHDLNIHNYGPERCFASVHTEVDANQDIMISHDIIDNIERDFSNEMNIHLVIHLDPIVTDCEETNHLRTQVEDIIKQVSPDITMHDFRVVKGTTHSNLIFDVCAPYSLKMTDSELVHIITNRIKQLDSTYFTVIVVDRSYVPRVD